MRVKFKPRRDRSELEAFALFWACRGAMSRFAQLCSARIARSCRADHDRLNCEILEARQMLSATPAGDVNFDNQFDKDDIMLVLQAGKYGTGEQAAFRQGDWNGDGVFNSGDLVLALQEGNYGQGQIVAEPAPPKNVILFIGDGMGFEHVKAARLYLGKDLSFEEFPFQMEMVTSNADADVHLVDSASAGTALATGVKVNQKVISQQIPGDGSDLTTILEVCKGQGKSTGLVTTSYVTDATPAVFGAHEPDRRNFVGIESDYLHDSRPNVLFGSDPYGLGSEASEVGYTSVTNVDAMKAVAAENHSVDSHVFGGFDNYDNLGYQDQFYDWESMALEADQVLAEAQAKPLPFDDLGTPHLSEMTEAAMEILGQNPDGFFLMVEGAAIDQTSHDASNNELGLGFYYPRAVAGLLTGTGIVTMETVELAHAVQTALDWTESRGLLGETLILVTADHETGGMAVTRDNGAGQFPDAKFTAKGELNQYGVYSYVHSTANVPVYAIGRNATLFGADSDYGKEILDNTEIFGRVLQSQSHWVNENVRG